MNKWCLFMPAVFLVFIILSTAGICDADPAYTPPGDTIYTTSKSLFINNFGMHGHDNEGASLDVPGDCDADLTYPNGDMYLYDASPMISWNDGVQNHAYTAIFTQWYDQEGTFKPLSPIWMSSEADYNQVSCTMATTDDVFGINHTLWGPTDGNDFVIIKFEFYPLSNPKGLEQVYIGMFLDWDVPSDYGVDNMSGFEGGIHTLWQRGIEANSEDEDPPHDCPILENDRYAGVALLSGFLRNGWTAENAPMIQGSGLNPDSLYDRMSGLYGIDLYDEVGEDSATDLHTGITAKRVDMTGGSTYSFVVAMATTNSGFNDFNDQIDSAWMWAWDHDIISSEDCPCQPGDANGDGAGMSVGDAVYIISHIFHGGPAPTPYEICSGDANGDCSCNIGDVVYIIAYVFKNGPWPPTCIEWVESCGAPR